MEENTKSEPSRLRNLKPLTDEARKKGTFVSNERRKRRKEVQTVFRDVLNLPLHGNSPLLENPKNLEEATAEGVNVTVITAMLAVQVKKALAGDTRSFEAVLKFMKNDLNINIAGLESSEEASKTHVKMIAALKSKNVNLDLNLEDNVQDGVVVSEAVEVLEKDNSSITVTAAANENEHGSSEEVVVNVNIEDEEDPY